MSYLPTEVLQDIFVCLNRNEVEKSQLVCRRWSLSVERLINYIPFRLLNELKIVHKSNEYPYAEADGELIFRPEESEKICRRRNCLEFCVVNEMKFDVDYTWENRNVQKIVKSLMVSSNKKLHVLKLFYRANYLYKLTGIFNFYLNYVIPEKILLSTTQSPERANEWRKYYKQVLKTPQPPRKICLFMTNCAFYPVGTPDYLIKLFTCQNYNDDQNYDPRIRLVFADDDKYYEYDYSHCMKLIEFYMNHGYPQKMVRSVKFERFNRYVPLMYNRNCYYRRRYYDSKQHLFREWLQGISWKALTKEITRNGSPFTREIFIIRPPTKDRAVKVIFCSRLRSDFDVPILEILTMKIRLFVK